MTDDIDPVGEHTAETARRWAHAAAAATGGPVLAGLRERVDVGADKTGADGLRRGPLLIAAAAVVLVGGIVGLLAFDRDGTDERLVPATQPVPTAMDSAVPVPVSTTAPATPTSATAVTAESTAAEPQTFVIDAGRIDAQNTFVERAVNLDVGPGIGALGVEECTGCSPLRPTGPTWVRDDFVAIGDPANGRVVIVPAYTPIGRAVSAPTRSRSSTATDRWTSSAGRSPAGTATTCSSPWVEARVPTPQMRASIGGR